MSANIIKEGMTVTTQSGFNVVSKKGTVTTNYDGMTVIPASLLKTVALNSVPSVIQEAIDRAKLDATTETLANSIISDLRNDIDSIEDGVYKKQYIDNSLTYLEQILVQKVDETTVAAIADARTVLALDGYATTNDITVLNSRVGNSETSIFNLGETINTKDAARALQISEVEASVNQSFANYSDVLDLTVDENGNVTAQKIEELKISVTDQTGDIDALKKQVDGKVEYFEGVYAAVDESFKPALVEPYKTWYEADIANGDDYQRALHTGDTFEQYEVVNGENEYMASWKFVKTDINFPNADADGYCWSVITNSVALDAYKKAVQAQQQNAALEVTLTETNTLLNTVQGWSANASKLITDTAGNLTGWSFGDGSNIKSYFTFLADKFFFKTDNGQATPFSIDGDDIVFNGKVSFANTTNVPDFATSDALDDVKSSFIGTNLAKNATITASTSISYVDRLSDDEKNIGVPYCIVGSSSQYLQYDFGENKFIGQTRIYFYKNDDREYSYKIAYSEDGSNWEYAIGDALNYIQSRESINGYYPIGIPCPTIDNINGFGRYVRIYMNGNTSNTSNHLLEVEILSSASNSDPYLESYMDKLKDDVLDIDNSLTQNEIDKATLDGKIDAEESARITAITTEQQTRANDILERIQAEAALDGKIDDTEQALIDNANALATAQANYTDTVAQALKDNEISTAEQNAINEAQVKVDAAKVELNSTIDALPDVNITENAITRIPNPLGGTFVGPSTTTGALVIELPMYDSNTMVSFDIDVYEYKLDNSFTLKVSGYISSSSDKWINTTANLIGSTDGDNKVTFARSSTKYAVIIGGTGTIWKYPKVTVRNLMASYINYAIDNWKDGWQVGVSTDISNFVENKVYADALIDAKAIKNQGALATQNSVTIDQIPIDARNSSIAWQTEVQNAINNDLTTIDGGKIVTNTALVNNLNALGGIVTDTIQLDSLTVLTDAGKLTGFGTSVIAEISSNDSTIISTFKNVRSYNDTTVEPSTYRFRSNIATNVVMSGASTRLSGKSYTTLGAFFRTSSAISGVDIQIRAGENIISSLELSFPYAGTSNSVHIVGNTNFLVAKTYTPAGTYSPATCGVSVAIEANSTLLFSGDGELNIKLVGINQSGSVLYDSVLLIHNNI